jgi:lipid-A-disaccharide synthase
VGALTLFLIAGEPSGDRLGAALMAGLKALSPDVRFVGVGGPLMQAEGMDSLFPMEELSVMGIAEVLPKYRALKRRIAQAAGRAGQRRRCAGHHRQPRFLPARGADREIRAPGLRTIHYVAPSVWAWRPGRAAKMARVIDHVLALLPFEPPYMTAAGMTCDFVGHPVVAEPLASDAERAGFAGEGPLLLALPGSRGARSRAWPRLRAGGGAAGARPSGLARGAAHTCAEWAGARPDARLARGAADRDRSGRKARGLCRGRVALAASGTVSLELAANGCPMVIAYDMHP